MVTIGVADPGSFSRIILFLNRYRKTFEQVGREIEYFFTNKIVSKPVWDPGSGKNLSRIQDPDPGGQKNTGSNPGGSKGTGSRIRKTDHIQQVVNPYLDYRGTKQNFSYLT
jgi:hypothetical protein